MLAADEKGLRWWGMDMRPRWRRRVAVVVGYFGFVVGIWGIGFTQDDRLSGHPILTALGVAVLTLVWKAVSVFRGNGVVKSFEDPPPGRTIAAARTAMVNGLDEWARYRYDVANFEAASEEQQAELLRRYRVGTFLVPAKVPVEVSDKSWRLDERERDERNSADRWSLKWVALYLATFAGSYVGSAGRHRQVDSMEVAAVLWAFFLLARTLPQARVLWTEPDPREVGGEMELVEREV